MADLATEKRIHTDAIRQIDEDRQELSPALEEMRLKRRRTEADLSERCSHVPLLLAQLQQRAKLLELACPLIDDLLPSGLTAAAFNRLFLKFFEILDFRELRISRNSGFFRKIS